MKKVLLVIIPDRLSVLIDKGEIVPRYYNPGNFFNEVHIMMINDDKPDPFLVQPMVGDANLILHNFAPPPHFFRYTLGWQPFLMKNWLKEAINSISKIEPAVIRCYGAHLNLAIASFVKKEKGIPFIVSLHTHPYLDAHREILNFRERIQKFLILRLSKFLKNADMILPVYKGIIDFLNNFGVTRYKVTYNTVNVFKTDQKTSWTKTGKGPFRCLCVGQQIANKNPENLIRAIANLDNVTLDIVGTGSLNPHLKTLASELSAIHKIKFIDSIPHKELCQRLKTYDCMATTIDCIGISKTIIEAFLAKLPVLINYNSHQQVPELNDSICLRVDNSPTGYAAGLKSLMSSLEMRTKLAQNAYQVASQIWDPKITEEMHLKVYKDILNHA